MTFLSPGRTGVACLGECMIELVERPDGLLSRGFGGDTLNTAVYLARLGIPVRYVTALGDDGFSQAMVAAWAAEGIDTAAVVRMPGRVPGLYLIQTDAGGERRFNYWRNSAPVRQLFDEPYAVAAEAALASTGAVYLSGITLSLFRPPARDRLLSVLAQLRAQGVRIVFDTNFRPRGWPDHAEARDIFGRMLRTSDIAFAGVEDFSLLDAAASAEGLLALLSEAGVAEAVVKLPHPGCLVHAGTRTTPVPVPALLRPVDTTAAGDSFAAAYLAARIAGSDPVAAALVGHTLAAAVILHPGAVIPRDAMPARPG